ncbi:MAG: aminotransferase class IV [Candidatus Micrarchaeota archaeon]|nr:aminotransferase class IV [Candidatus Micrarchaeota archaeon]
MRVYLNGGLVDSAQVSVFDEGLLYGYGVYETLRVYRGVAFRRTEHVRRLCESARQIGMACPDEKALFSAIQKTIAGNHLSDAALRIILTAGAQSEWGNAPQSLIVMAKAAGTPQTEFSAINVPYHRNVAQAKTLNCLTAVVARNAAKKAGANEALYTKDANVLEGTTCNVFAVVGRELLTPNEGVLSGITAGIVMKLAKKQGLSVRQEALPLDRLLSADEAFITSTLKQIVPLTKVDGKNIPTGPVTRKLQSAFLEYVEHEISGQK